MSDSVKTFKIERSSNSQNVQINNDVDIESENNLNIERDNEVLNVSKNNKPRTKLSHPQLTNENLDTNHTKPRLVSMEGLDLLSNPKKISNESANDFSARDSDDHHDYSSSDNDSVKDSFTNNLFEAPQNDRRDESDHNYDLFNQRNNDPYKSDSDHHSVSSISLHSDDSRDEPRERAKTYEEIQREKQFLLFKLNRLEKTMGVKLQRRFTMASNIEDMKFEYEKLKRERDVDKGVKFQRKALMAFSSGVEYLNNKFDPIDAKLDGWSESIMENIDDYDEVFEELHDKYSEKIEVAPEIKLLMMVGGSAFMFHLTKTLFSSSKIGNIDDILNDNPNIMRDIQNAAMNKMSNNLGEDGAAFGNMMRDGLNMHQQRHHSGGSGGMRGPQGVNDILGGSEDVSASDADGARNMRSGRGRRTRSKQTGINIDI